MLIGIGADILQIERFRRSLARFGRGYLEEVFSEEELVRSEVPANLTEAAFYARAFCAKEACAKALGTGIDETVDWYDISVDQSSLPATITLFGGAITTLAALTPTGFRSIISLDVGSKNGAGAGVRDDIRHTRSDSERQLIEWRLLVSPRSPSNGDNWRLPAGYFLA